MFKLEAKTVTQAINAAKALKADSAVLYASKHGVLFGTRSDAGTFLTLLSKDKQEEASVLLKLEDLTTATHKVNEMEMDIKSDHIVLKPKGIRSVIKLVAEPAKTGDMTELWESRNSGNSANMLTKMLSENRDLFCIKDNVGGKAVPVHIRWNKEGVAAGMSDLYHGVSVKTSKAPGAKDKARELFVYSSWLPLLLDYLVPTEEKGAAKVKKKKDDEALPGKGDKALLTITEKNISVSTKTTLLVLQAIVPGNETITLDNIAQITGSENLGGKLKVSMSAINAALTRSLAVLPREASIKFTVSAKKPEVLRIEGVHDSGSRIVEEVETSRAKKPFGFTCTVYNLLDITNAKVPNCNMALTSRKDSSSAPVVFSYDYSSRSDTIYRVDLFSVATAG